MANSQEIRFHLSLTAEQYLAYYRGDADQVVVRAYDGRSVKFPANVLRPFLTHSGIEGDFVLEYDENNRFIGIRCVSHPPSRST